MDNKLIPDYISTSAALLGIPMDAARLERVAAHLQRTAAMAAMLDGADLAVHDEIAEIYNPLASRPSIDENNQL
ncbi:MAG: DUF4089 domain-containing protein [Polaromonas sp.]|nr:DUF4089 domain-containing protein [Polaromonas sp.]